MSKPKDQCFDEFFNNHYTSLEEIGAAGWKRYYSSGGGWWWVKYDGEGRKMMDMPHWIMELLHEAEKYGCETAQFQMRQALGLKK